MSGGASDSLAHEYGLELAFHADFQEIFQREQDVPQYADLLRRMKVVDQNGETDMTGDQWEAASEFVDWACGVMERLERKQLTCVGQIVRSALRRFRVHQEIAASVATL